MIKTVILHVNLLNSLHRIDRDIDNVQIRHLPGNQIEVVCIRMVGDYKVTVWFLRWDERQIGERKRRIIFVLVIWRINYYRIPSGINPHLTGFAARRYIGFHGKDGVFRVWDTFHYPAKEILFRDHAGSRHFCRNRP